MEHSQLENTKLVVALEHSGLRLDVYLYQMCDKLPSRSYAAKLIKNGNVLVNKKIRKSSFVLKMDDRIEIDFSFLFKFPQKPQAEDIPLDVIFEDEHILVINKPAGLVVHPGAGISSGTLVNALLGHCGSGIPSLDGQYRAGIVHRLDRDTSGVMVTAKTQAALTELSKQFAEHAHHRVYHALCYGLVKAENGRIETGHVRDPNNRLKYKAVSVGEGKRAAMTYRLLNSFVNDQFSLVECTLETGRTHQIRVQMEYLKHPIVGDSLYARIPDKILNQKLLASKIKKLAIRQMLHAVLLEITHPITKERMRFNAPYAKDFEEFFGFLEVDSRL